MEIFNKILNAIGIKGLIAIGALLALLLVTPFNGIQFILLALTPILYLVTLRKGVREIVITKSDLGWGVFSLVGLLSFFWATDSALIWGQLIGWSLMIVWMIIARHWIQKENNVLIFESIIKVVFWVLLLHQMIAIHFEIPLSKTDWNQFLFKNSNYTTSYLLVLYCYILFSDISSKFLGFVRIIAGALIANILYLSDARGAMIALAFLIALYVLVYFKINRNIYKAITFLMVPVMIYGIASVLDISVAKLIMGEQSTSRLHLMSSSLSLLTNNIFTGVGLGNWFVEVYQYTLPDTIPFNDSNALTRLPSHNVYAEKMAELGLVGGLALILGMAYPLIRGIKKLHHLSHLKKSAMGALLVYIVLNCFYRDANFHDQHFSSLQVLAFISIGILSSESFVVSKKRMARYILLVFSIIGLLWFTYSRNCNTQVYRIMSDLTADTTEQSITKLDNINNPIFYSQYRYDQSFNHLLGKLNSSSGNLKDADRYYLLAIEKSPYNCQLLFDYAKFLIEKKGSVEWARPYLERVIAIQGNHSESLRMLKLMER